MHLTIHQIADLAAAAAHRCDLPKKDADAIHTELLRVLIERERMLSDWMVDNTERGAE